MKDEHDSPGEDADASGPADSKDPHDSRTLAPSADRASRAPAFPVTGWDRYQFVGYVGEGGMGRVYRALDLKLGRQVALKFIRGDDPEAISRFTREARAQARVDHDHVCKVYETGEVEGKQYIAMQFIDGRPLSALRDELTLEQKVKLMKEVAEGIQSAHRIGLIHRDIKPGNIMVEKTDEGWHPYVLDFGLARETQAQGITTTGAMVGTPGFMAPEQAWGDANLLDRRMDVYSLGATLYFLLGGISPFEGESTMVTLRKMLQEEPRPLAEVASNIPADLETIVMKCLEKEPTRRYESARALAQDLQRWLDGEPIEARRASIGYRLAKKARKHKALVTVSVAALIAILALSYYGIRTSLQARQRAALAQSLGQRVERMNAILRVGHTIPLHDTRLERRLIQQQLREIESEMKELGPVAYGPGNYALGRGYLSLDNYGSARDHLQKAWDSGYRDPEVGYALGLALGRIYQQELETVENIRNKDVREARRKEIEKEFRVPAVRYLSASRGAESAAPEYVEGLIELYEKRYESALEKARQAWNRLPWLYEARLLEGNVYTALANKKRIEGDNEGALADYARARGAYEAAIRVGESDGQAYEDLCTLSMYIMHTRIYSTGGDLSPDVETAKNDCGKALQADPDRAGAYTKLSNVFWIYGNALTLKGEDPTRALQQSIDNAQQAIQLDPNSALAYKNLGTAYQLIGNYDLQKNQDPNKPLSEAIRHYSRALELAPGDIATYNSLGNTYAIQGDYERTHGRDPRNLYRRSIDTFKKGLATNANFAYLYSNLGVTYKDLSLYEESHGFEPERSMKEAIEAYKKCLELKPDDALAWNNLANGYKNIAVYYRRTGRSPDEFLQLGREAGEKAIAINPSYATPYSNLTELYVLTGESAELRNEDPGPWFQKAESSGVQLQSLRKDNAQNIADLAGVYVAMARNDLKKEHPPRTLARAEDLLNKSMKIDSLFQDEAFQKMAQLKLLEAKFLIRDHKSPDAVLRQAREAIAEALSRNPQNPFYLKNAAEIRLTEALHSTSPGRDSVMEGLAAVEKAITIHSRSAECYAIRSKLLELLAKTENPEENTRRAADSMAQALKLNPELKPIY